MNYKWKNNVKDITHDINGQPLAYRNDVRLRASELEIALTKEHIQEITRCRDDIVYFLETYCYFNHPEKGLSIVELYDWQRDLLRHIHKNKFSALLLPRQSGKCLYFFTKIKIKNKKTGKIKNISIGRFYIEQKIKHFFKKILHFFYKLV